MNEKEFEDILAKYPELIEEGLSLLGRQITLYGRRMDLLFEDQFKGKLIVELKAGPIKDEHIGQILSYEGMLLSSEDPTIRVMLIGNRVPPNIRRSLDHHGIAWKEITLSHLRNHVSKERDEELLKLFEEETTLLKEAAGEASSEKAKLASSERIIKSGLSTNNSDFEVQVLREGFVSVFGVQRPQEFGSPGSGGKGFYDGNQGVQWNSWVDFRDRVANISVNSRGSYQPSWRMP